MRRDRHDVGIGAPHLADLGRERRIGEQPFALAEHLVAVRRGLILHHAEGGVRMGEVLLDAAIDRLEVRVLRLDPGEQRLVHVEFARHVAERPLRDLGEPAFGGDVRDDRELQPGIGRVARLLLQDAEQRFGHVRAGRPDRHEGIGRGDAAHHRDAFLGVAAIIQEFDRELGLAAVTERDAAGTVDHFGGGLQGRLAVDAEDADDAGLGAEAGDLDGAFLRGCGRRAGERKRAQRHQYGTFHEVLPRSVFSPRARLFAAGSRSDQA